MGNSSKFPRLPALWFPFWRDAPPPPPPPPPPQPTTNNQQPTINNHHPQPTTNSPTPTTNNNSNNIKQHLMLLQVLSHHQNQPCQDTWRDHHEDMIRLDLWLVQGKMISVKQRNWPCSPNWYTPTAISTGSLFACCGVLKQSYSSTRRQHYHYLPNHVSNLKQSEPTKKQPYFPLYWLFNRHPYNAFV